MRTVYFVGFLIFGYLGLRNYQEVYIKDILGKSEGIKVYATVDSVPRFCKISNNRMRVKYQDRFYMIIISKNNCSSKKYENYDMIQLTYVSRFDKLFLEAKNVVLSQIINLSFFIFPLLMLFKSLKPGKLCVGS